MKVRAIKTHKIRVGENTLEEILDQYIKRLREKSVVAISSVIISLLENRVVEIGTMDKDDLIKREADWYLPRKISRYNLMFTITRDVLIPSAGIDESNTGGYYALWPKDLQKTANAAREFLAKKFKLKYVGVVITDSTSRPLRKGTTGIAIAASGFSAVNFYMGKPDVFGRKLQMTRANVMDALAAAAVAEMGEGAEQTPLAVLDDLSFVQFQARNPSKKELDAIRIDREDDLYGPLLKAVKWRKGLRRIGQ